jgi:serine/threonine-protein kinase
VRQVHQLGDTFAGYEIEEVLGRGGMSEVVRAKNPKLGNVVALKLLAPELAEDDLFRERFVRESRIAASLDHPNVLPIHDAGEADGVPYIAMRFVDGPNLGELLKRGELPLSHAVSIVGQVAGALDVAHERGLIHRDVKPANILIDRYTGADAAPHVYLADFGVAKHTLSRSGLTTTGEFVGTIDYVAPEQIEGKTIDARTDVYSLGCVFYECLTGKKPFDRDSNVAVMYAHLMEPPPAPSEEREGLPAEVDAVVAKALAKAPEDRYATCGELAAAARAALADTTSAGAIATSAGAVSGTIGFLDIDSGTGVVARPLPPPPAETEPVSTNGDAKTRRLRPAASLDKRYVLVAAVALLALAGAGLAATQLLGSSNAVATPPPKTKSTTTTHKKPPRPVLIAVPYLRGKSQARAIRLLKARGLRVSVVHEHSTLKKGRVISQVPRPGKRREKNAVVRLVVSTGPAAKRHLSAPPPPIGSNPPPPPVVNPPPPVAPPPPPPPPPPGGCHGC